MFVKVCTTYLLLLWCLCSWTVKHNIYDTQKKNGRSHFGILYIRLLKIKLLDKYWWCIWCKNECHHSLEENFSDGSLPSRQPCLNSFTLNLIGFTLSSHSPTSRSPITSYIPFTATPWTYVQTSFQCVLPNQDWTH